MFLHTFISTYRSFTTPWELFQKLKERFFIPETIEKEKIRAIQLRVAVVLKYWLQNQISDFDKNLLSEVVNFVDNTLQKNGYEETAGGLRKIIERKLLDCEEETRLLFPNPTRLNVIALFKIISKCDYLLLTSYSFLRFNQNNLSWIYFFQLTN